MTTIKDVARLAGVSPATVSNCLNKTKPVSYEKEKRILEAIAKTNFVPNAAGKNLRSNMCTDIGVILPNLDDPHYISILNGISAYFRDTEFFLNTAVTNDEPLVERRMVNRFRSKNLFGLILISCKPSKNYVREAGFDRDNIPVVEIERRTDSEKHAFLTFDNFETFRKTTALLLSRGYKKIALLTGPADFSGEQAAREGYNRAFREAGLVEDAELVFSSEISIAGAFRTASEVIARTNPEVILTTYESMAAGVREALSLQGYDSERSPVIAPGHKFWSRYTDSKLFFPIGRPSFAIGKEAARMLHHFAELSPQNKEVCLKDDFTDPFFREYHAKPYAVESSNPVKILMVSNPQVDFLRQLLPRFRRETNIDIEITAVPHKDVYNAIMEEKGRGRFDGLTFNISWLHALLDSRILSDLTPYMEEAGFDPGIYLPGCMEYYGHYNGKNYGLPYMYTPQILFYRKDLFEDPGLSKSYEAAYGTKLRIPKTWEEFNNVASFFLREKNPESPTGYGSVPAAAYTACLAPEFYLRLNSSGGRIFDEHFQVCFSSAQTRKAYQSLINSLNLAPEKALGTNYVTAAADFLKGDMAMLITYPTFSNELMGMQHIADSAQVGFAPLPSRAAVFYGWSMGVARDSLHKPEAYKFIHWICGREIADYCTIMAAQSPIADIYQNEEFVKLYPWLPLLYSAYEYAKPIIPPHGKNKTAISRQIIDDIICKDITEVVRQERTIDEAIAHTQSELERLFNRFGYWQRG